MIKIITVKIVNITIITVSRTAKGWVSAILFKLRIKCETLHGVLPICAEWDQKGCHAESAGESDFLGPKFIMADFCPNISVNIFFHQTESGRNLFYSSVLESVFEGGVYFSIYVWFFKMAESCYGDILKLKDFIRGYFVCRWQLWKELEDMYYVQCAIIHLNWNSACA